MVAFASQYVKGSLIVYFWFWLVLFNVYGPRAQSDDLERIEFKRKFYKILQVKQIFVPYIGPLD